MSDKRAANVYSPSSEPENRATFSRALWLALAALLSSVAWPQTLIPDMPSDGLITAEQLETSIVALESQEDLDDLARTRAIDQLRDAQKEIQNRHAAEQAAANFARAVEAAPAEVAALQQQLAADPPPPPTAQTLGIRPTKGLTDFEQMLAREAATLAATESNLAELETQIDTQETRPEQARRRISELRRSRDALEQQAHAEPPPAEPKILTDARRLARTLRRDALSAEIHRLEQELLSHAARIEVLYVQRDLAQRAVTEQRQRITFFQAQVNERRQEAALAAREQAELTERAAAEKHSVVRRLAEGNAALTRELPEIVAETDRATAALGAVEEQARQLEQNLARSRQRLEIAGVNEVVGQLLLEERRNLPKASQFRAELRDRRMALSRIGLAQDRIEEQRRELTPLNARIEQAMAEVEADVSSGEELEQIEREVRSLLQNRRELLQQAASTYTSFLSALGDLDIAQRRLLSVADDYEELLDRNLLWTPSSPVVNLQTLRDLGPASRWVLTPESWKNTWSVLLGSLREYTLLAVAAALLWVLLIVALQPLKSGFKATGQRVGRVSTDHIGLTLAGLLIVAVRALPFPLALALTGIGLRDGPASTDFSAAVAKSLLVTAPFLYNVILYRSLCAEDGLARIQFGWHRDRLLEIRRRLDRLALIGAPWVFVTVLAFEAPIAAIQDSLGRALFVGLMFLLSVTIAPLLRAPSGGQPASSETVGLELTIRLRRFWFALAAGGPLLLAVLAMLGYRYTAAILIEHLVDTLWLMLGVVLANLIVLRWLSLTRHKISWKLAMQQHEDHRTKGKQETDKAAEGEIPVAESKPIDLDAVDQQTRRLLRAGLGLVTVLGLWGIWSEVLPALSILEEVSLWSQTVTIDGQESIVPVTLADLLLALVIIVATIVASKNLPGLMEIALLQRLNLETGSRYAINTLVRYGVVALGAISVLSIVGWNWTQIQWLVAALSVGLGFGLQEIVANFVSGLIILFERPVRVGDTVTVGQLTGTVSRLQIRATTIIDWDRKEIIVPNKSFITDPVVNWTLSDPVTRIVVPVAVSYGSDVKLVRRVMEDTLHALPLVLDEPAPKVYFVGFGDSALNFTLQVYSRQLSDRLPLTHAVHEEILSALRKHSIEIPFPQRDLHLRSIDQDIALRSADNTPLARTTGPMAHNQEY